MATTDEQLLQLFKRQSQPSANDLRECGWLQTQFPQSFGSGGELGLEIGLDGHLWVIIPIRDRDAEAAARGAGAERSVFEIIPDHVPDGWKLHANFYKLSRGFWKRAVWVASIQLSNSQHMKPHTMKTINLGFIAAYSVRQFAVDLRLMLDHGYSTFQTALEAFEAAP